MQIGTFIQQAEQGKFLFEVVLSLIEVDIFCMIELSKMKFFLPILLLSVAVAMTVADPDEDMWSFYKVTTSILFI